MSYEDYCALVSTVIIVVVIGWPIAMVLGQVAAMFAGGWRKRR